MKGSGLLQYSDHVHKHYTEIQCYVSQSIEVNTVELWSI